MQRVTGSICYYYLTTIVVVAGVYFSVEYVPRRWRQDVDSHDLFSAFANWDGAWYTKIAQQGYSYDPGQNSSVAFFPLYPLIGNAISSLTGIQEQASLLLVSHICLIGVFVMFAIYVDERYGRDCGNVRNWTLLAMGLWPTTVFFRMVYTESLFLLLLLVVMRAMLKRWPTVLIAFAVGLATACRPTGVALLGPFLLYLWQQRQSRYDLIKQAVLFLPIACWGLLAYMAFQYIQFGDVFAFAKTQANWAVRQPASFSEYATSLFTLEPIWGKYCPASVGYWARQEPAGNPLLSLEFANPIYFVSTASLVIAGAKKRWLDSREILLAVFLLGIPYITHGYDSIMFSQARYAAVVFPAFMVVAQILERLPPPLAALLETMSALLLGVYAVMFAAWFRIF